MLRQAPSFAKSYSTVAMILALATAFSLAGCGRKGKLEPPPGQQLVEKDGKQEDPGPVRPKTSFVLDPLLN